MSVFAETLEALDALCSREVFVVAEMNERPVMIAKGELQRRDVDAGQYLQPGSGEVAVYALDGPGSSPPVAVPVFADALVTAGRSKVAGGMTDGAPVVALVYGDGFVVRVSRVDGGEV